jgi:hypothetical protein
MPEVRGYHASANLIHVRPGSSIADVETVGNEDPASSSPALARRCYSA